MAETLLLPVVRSVVGKAADALVQKITGMCGIDDDRIMLERQMVYVQSFLADAEVKAETNDDVRAWMKALKTVFYQANDIFDNLQYEALRRKTLSVTGKVLSNFTSNNRFVFSLKASKDLKNVLHKIDKLVAERRSFDLVERAEAPPQVLPWQTHSALDESMDLFGRDHDKEEVVKLLLNQKDQDNVQVLPIIGMGGLGKTTLAKMVFNDNRIQKHFELKMWHCVSYNFEVTSIVNSLIQLATNGSGGLSDNIELLRGKLQEAVGGKRFLLILDDVWNEERHKWDDDLRPLLCSSSGGPGSWIVVTSRSQQVAEIMGTLPPHELVCLNEDDSWELFSKKAFSKGVEKREELVRIGRSICNKCKGLPLALKTMGGLMSSKKQAREWETIADCNVSDTDVGKDTVLPILKLSYKHLSPEMKQCFAFCAVFPKDYEMEKDKLIQLWIANGFILEEGTMDLMQKGERIFGELAWRSFLQDVNVKFFYGNQFSYHAVGCKMHDLMHDLAKDISAECANETELIKKKTLIEDVFHMHISSYGSENISGLLKGASSLHTLLITQSRHLNIKGLKLTSLRALCYEDPYIIDSQLVNKAYLRYLDLSGSDIYTLPDSVCMLYNLISLRLNGCKSLWYIPDGIISLRKLMHLYLLNCCNLIWMPPKLSLLHDLCILTMFVVGTKEGCGIDELKDLKHLSHRMELYKLRNVKSGAKANLHKKHISELLLDWDHKINEALTNDEANTEAEVLESLVPPDEFNFLEIRGYHGHAISDWMRDPQKFRCLRTLTMFNCPKCKDIPIVWLSSSLEHVSLSGMDSLTTLCKNINVEVTESSYPQVFPRLKKMELKKLPNLERWTESSTGEPHRSVMFPQLEELRVYRCNKLESLPEAPLLTRLACFEYVSTRVRPMAMPLGYWPSLVKLELGSWANVTMSLQEQQVQSQTSLQNLRRISLVGETAFVSIFDLRKLPLGLGQGLSCLEELCIMNCSSMRWPVEELQYLRCLRFLKIWKFQVLARIASEEILPLPLLERLEIIECDRLPEIPQLPTSLERVVFSKCGSLVALPSNLGNLSKLRVLCLSNCCGLRRLPDGMEGLTSLEELGIRRCQRIDEFPCGLLERLPQLKDLTVEDCPDLQRHCLEGGNYFHFLSSIPRKSIRSSLSTRGNRECACGFCQTEHGKCMSLHLTPATMCQTECASWSSSCQLN